MKLKREKIWNVPNVLTMIRMLLIPVYWVLFMQGHRFIALAVFIVASLTDLADGYIARKYNLITDFGKLMDPLADKLMVITLMICQGIAGIIPWAAIIIVMVKELLMVLGGYFMLKHDVVVYSNMAGKVAQCFFILALTLSFFHAEFMTLGVQVDLIVLWLSVALTIYALAAYALDAVKKLKHK